MSLRKRLLVKPPSGALVPSEHFGVALYEGDGSTSHSINGGKFGAGAYFNGSSGYITVSNDVFPSTTVFSISFTVKTRWSNLFIFIIVFLNVLITISNF